MPKKKRKTAEELTTDEAIGELFHPKVADALRDAIEERSDEEESTDDDATP